jgi:hypothetical protein
MSFHWEFDQMEHEVKSNVRPRVTRVLVLSLGIALIISGGLPLAKRILADTKPNMQLNVANTQPREVEDNTQQSVIRDYSAAWKGMSTALANNSLAPLRENFTGFALDKLSQRVHDQQENGLTTRIIDRGHKVEAVFYSPDGSAIELKDTAAIETQILDGSTVIHSDQTQVHYYAVLTGAEDRWKVRVLESAK